MIRMMKSIVMAAMIVAILSGCMYPQDQKVENQVPYPAQLQNVQTAVNQFKNDTGVLPIQTRDAKTPIYQKYPIDFQRLMPKYMEKPPGNAFENGGVYQYVLINAETAPEVKLIDLISVDEVQKLQTRVNIYKQDHQYPPYKDVLEGGAMTLDYKKLGYKKEPHVVSPYSKKNLPLVIDKNGQIYIDYRIDLYQMLKSQPHTYKEGDDIREILVKNAVFVPAYSLPYTIKNDQPVFMPTK